MQGEGMSGKGLAGRFAGAALLVYGTFNPEGISYYHWAVAPWLDGAGSAARTGLPLKLLVGLLLGGGWAFFLQATRRSIGWKGALLVAAILATLVWALVDWGILDPGSSRAVAHLVLVALTVVLTLGMSWSHLSRKLSGQVDTDETD